MIMMKAEYVRFMCSAARDVFILNREVLNVSEVMLTSLTITENRVSEENIDKFELILTSLLKINEDDINDLRVNVIEVELIFFLFVEITDCNEVVAETDAAILKLVADCLRIFSVESYTDEDDIALNELRADFNSFNITDEICVNSLKIVFAYLVRSLCLRISGSTLFHFIIFNKKSSRESVSNSVILIKFIN